MRQANGINDYQRQGEEVADPQIEDGRGKLFHANEKEKGNTWSHRLYSLYIFVMILLI